MRFAKPALLFCLGGGMYAALELLWRGRTHISMFLLGGGCFLLLGKLRKVQLPLPLLPILGASAITLAELATGLAVNRSYCVWDYRGMPLNFLGQICLPYSLLWIPVSLAGMQIYDAIERKWRAPLKKP